MENSYLIPYSQLRKTLGYLGLLFPILLIVIDNIFGDIIRILPTVSDYYHTGMRDFFVGTLCAIGIFLYTHKGHKNQDWKLMSFCGLMAIGVAFFPTGSNKVLLGFITVGFAHLTCAALLFLGLAYISLKVFTKDGSKEDPNYVMTAEKKIRNKVFTVCGWAILIFVLMIALYHLLNLDTRIPDLKMISPVFWLETFALWAFGLSWLTKGEGILEDKNKEENKDKKRCEED